MGYNANEIYQSDSKWLKAADLRKQEHLLTIQGVELVDVEDKQNSRTKKQLEISFVGKEKTLLLNKTNSDAISYAYTPDTDQWLGKQITLYPTMVPFGDRTVEAIRLRPALPQAGGVQEMAQAAHEDQFAAAQNNFDESDIPF